VGTTLADLIIMREVTCHTAGATAAAQQALPATAFGVFEALREIITVAHFTWDREFASVFLHRRVLREPVVSSAASIRERARSPQVR
jgi:hypothetical protein